MSNLFTFHDTSVIDVRELVAVEAIESGNIDYGYTYYIKFAVLFKCGEIKYIGYDKQSYESLSDKRRLLTTERNELIKIWETRL